MKVSKSSFGTHNGQAIDLFAIENDNGMVVKIMNYGATITSIKVPEGDKQVELACGFDQFDGYFAKEYVDNAPYFGSTVGRYCSQIKDSKFTMDGKEYQLNVNCGDNNLHGGVVGFDKKVWTATETENGVEMSLLSKDMEEGFPGNVEVKINFSLTNDNEIKIAYWAKPDAKTPLAMTNHTYFNLSAFETSVEPFTAKIFTNKLMKADDTGAATGEILDVSGTVNDLQEGKVIGDVHEANGTGFEHFYIFDADFKLKQTAEINDPASGRKLQVFTSEPCMLLYTGMYTSDELKRESGEQYGKYRGFCCETHRYQNGVNIPDAPKSFTEANEEFVSETIFKLTF